MIVIEFDYVRFRVSPMRETCGSRLKLNRLMSVSGRSILVSDIQSKMLNFLVESEVRVQHNPHPGTTC